MLHFFGPDQEAKLEDVLETQSIKALTVSLSILYT
jgi:hypothetical protein